jgi:DNA-binding LacI/PurR family transcriptional regulator
MTLQRAISTLINDGLIGADGNRATIVLASGNIGGAAEDLSSNSVPIVRSGSRVGIMFVGSDLHEWNFIIRSAIERRVSALGGSTVYRHSKDAADGARELLNADCDVLIADSIHTTIDVDAVLGAVARRAPVVFVTTADMKRPLRSVYYDSFDVGYQAGEYLIERGVQSALYVATCSWDWARDRALGIQAAFAVAGLGSASLRVAKPGDDTKPGKHEFVGYHVAVNGLTAGKPDAIIGCNDEAALGARTAALECGMVAGQDYSLIGFDDIPDAAKFDLTTFRPPLEQMGLEAARLAEAALSGDRTSQKISLHSHLIERSSALRATPRGESKIGIVQEYQPKGIPE